MWRMSAEQAARVLLQDTRAARRRRRPQAVPRGRQIEPVLMGQMLALPDGVHEPELTACVSVDCMADAWASTTATVDSSLRVTWGACVFVHGVRVCVSE